MPYDDRDDEADAAESIERLARHGLVPSPAPARPGRARALAAIGTMRKSAGLPALAAPATGSPIASSITDAVTSAMKVGAPYAGDGGALRVHADVEHTAADGSRTVARIGVEFSRGSARR